MPAAPSQFTVTSGTSYTTPVTNVLVKFNSPTAGAKTVDIPASTGSLTTIVLFDLYGAINGPAAGGADSYNITPVPASGNIYGNYVVSTAGGAVTLLDATEGWTAIDGLFETGGSGGFTGAFNLSDYGASSALADNATVIQNCINAAEAYAATTTTGGAVVIADSATYKILSGLTYNPALISINWNGATIDATGMTSGSCFTVNSTNTSFGQNERNVFQNLSLNGPGLGNAVDMFTFQTANPNTNAQSIFRNVLGVGFRRGHVYSNNAYLVGWYDSIVANCATGVYFPAGATNSVENIKYFGGVIGQNTLAIDMETSTAGELHCFGVSFDFNGAVATVNQGMLVLHACSLETLNLSAPYLHVGNGSGAVIIARDCHVLCDESTNSMYSFQADGLGTLILDGCFMNNLSNGNSINQLTTGTGTIIIKNTQGFAFSGAFLGSINNTMGSLNSSLNAFADGGFESSTQTIVDQIFIYNDTAAITNPYTGTNISMVINNTFPITGAQSLAVTKAGAATTAAGFCICAPCLPGQTAVGLLNFRKPGTATGSILTSVGWGLVKYVSGVPTLTNFSLINQGPSNFTSADSGLLAFGQAFNPLFRAPAWATHYVWRVDMTSFNAGVIYYDNCNFSGV